MWGVSVLTSRFLKAKDLYDGMVITNGSDSAAGSPTGGWEVANGTPPGSGRCQMIAARR